MKSIMEQASSIMKAIEKAWVSADKPKEFSVKIFEKEEKNFFGMTTKPAKIGIFFSDQNSHPQEKNIQKARPENSKSLRSVAAAGKPIIDKKIIIAEKSKIDSNRSKTTIPQPTLATWNELMIDAVKVWINKTVTLMGIGAIDVNSEIAGKVLKLTFSRPLLEDPLAEKYVFRSIAHLVMASLRNQYKKEIKDLKIVLIRPQ